MQGAVKYINWEKFDIGKGNGGLTYLLLISGAFASILMQKIVYVVLPSSIFLALHIFNLRQIIEQLDKTDLTQVHLVQKAHDERLDSISKDNTSFQTTGLELKEENSSSFKLLTEQQLVSQLQSQRIQSLIKSVNEQIDLINTLKLISASTGKIESQLCSAETYYNRGQYQEKIEHYEGAIADYSEAITISPEFAEAYFRRGLLHKTIQLNQFALSDLNLAAKYFLQQGDFESYQTAKEQCNELQSLTLSFVDEAEPDMSRVVELFN